MEYEKEKPKNTEKSKNTGLVTPAPSLENPELPLNPLENILEKYGVNSKELPTYACAESKNGDKSPKSSPAQKGQPQQANCLS